jgi:hypothetical protein
VHVPPEGSQQYWRERERSGIVELDYLPPGY